MVVVIRYSRVEVKLTRGQFAVVDPEDLERVNEFKWRACWDPDVKSFYARRSVRIPGENKTKSFSMHRLVLGLGPWNDDRRQVDHVNHDTLDNRKSNLKIVTCRQNHENRTDQSHLGVGVEFRSDLVTRPYRARATVNGQTHHIGRFDTAEEAGRARNEFVARLTRNQE